MIFAASTSWPLCAWKLQWVLPHIVLRRIILTRRTRRVLVLVRRLEGGTAEKMLEKHLIFWECRAPLQL